MPNLPVDERPLLDQSGVTPSEALTHFERLLALETDCGDLHAALTAGYGGFVVLDVRSQEAFASEHIPGAQSLPYRRITDRHLAGYPPDTIFVVYCSSALCNGADKAAVRLARLGRPVKKMLGGVAGWKAEGYPLETT